MIYYNYIPLLNILTFLGVIYWEEQIKKIEEAELRFESRRSRTLDGPHNPFT